MGNLSRGYPAMMRFRPLSKLRSYLLPAVAAIFLVCGPMACSSSGEESPSPALEGAASGEQAANGNNAATNGENSKESAKENGNAAAANANTEASNTAAPEGGEASAPNNPVGNELNNAIANGKEGAEPATANEGGAINSEANSNSAGTGAAPAASAADANSSNPFAAPANAAAAVPSNAAPSDPGAATPPTASAAPAPEAPAAAPAAASAEPETAPAAASAAPAAPAASGGESAAAPTGPTSLPEMGSKMAYYVMRGDTLGAIAQKIYGSRKKWKALQAENGLADANKIYPGDVIYFTLNDSSKAFAEKYEIGNKQAYTIAKGDTLARLAAKFYGTQGAWRALWKENPQILNPDRIRVGMVLTYRTTTKVALRDENDAEEEITSSKEDGTADNDNEDSQGVVENSGDVAQEMVQFTASAE